MLGIDKVPGHWATTIGPFESIRHLPEHGVLSLISQVSSRNNLVRRQEEDGPVRVPNDASSRVAMTAKVTRYM